jgi:hypothetical protein
LNDIARQRLKFAASQIEPGALHWPGTIGNHVHGAPVSGKALWHLAAASSRIETKPITTPHLFDG